MVLMVLSRFDEAFSLVRAVPFPAVGHGRERCESGPFS